MLPDKNKIPQVGDIWLFKDEGLHEHSLITSIIRNNTILGFTVIGYVLETGIEERYYLSADQIANTESSFESSFGSCWSKVS